MYTQQDVTVSFRNYGNITIPMGTRVTNRTALGVDPKYHFVNEYGWITKQYPDIANILIHDAKYYGIDIPAEFIGIEKNKMVEYNGKMVMATDCTPTWENMLPVLLTLLRDGDAEGKKTATNELQRMAQIADQYVAEN
jgi:hypothetical protein